MKRTIMRERKLLKEAKFVLSYIRSGVVSGTVYKDMAIDAVWQIIHYLNEKIEKEA